MNLKGERRIELEFGISFFLPVRYSPRVDLKFLSLSLSPKREKKEYTMVKGDGKGEGETCVCCTHKKVGEEWKYPRSRIWMRWKGENKEFLLLWLPLSLFFGVLTN